MNTSVCLLLLVGLSSTSSDISVEYSYISEFKAWPEAQEYCRNVHIDLATVENMRNMRSLLKTVDPQYKGLVWIGLERGTEQRWQWSLWNSSQPITYTNWEPDEPGGRGDECAAKCEAGLWCDIQCGASRYFICFDESNGKYIAVHNNVPWRQAQLYCRELYTDLAPIPNSEAENEITKVIDSQYVYWTGYFQDSWEWSDKSQKSSFRYWMSGKPDNYGSEEKCTAIDMSNGGLWDDLSCKLNLPFICLGEERNKIVRLMFSSTEDLALGDTSVVILEQIKSKLIESGLPPDIRLRWRNLNDGRALKPRK